MDSPHRSTCPVASTLDLVGDRWTLLVLRDLLIGKQYYDELLASPEGIATNILSDRLRRLQAMEMIEGRVCASNRRRKQYKLTARGRSFAPVLVAIAKWGLANIDSTAPWPEAVAALEKEMKRQREESS